MQWAYSSCNNIQSELLILPAGAQETRDGAHITADAPPYTDLDAAGLTQLSGVSFIIFPGNPGLIRFYADYIIDLHARLGHKHSFVGLGYAGHSREDLNDGAEYTLDQQTEHKKAWLRMLADANPDVQFVVLGHSIGAYQAHQCLLDDDLPIVRVVSLFGTFQKLNEGLTPFIRMAIQPAARVGLASLLHFSPGFLKRFLLELTSGSRDEVKYLDESILSYHLVSNVLTLAYTETQQVVDLDLDALRKVQHKMIFLWSDDDPYVPLDMLRHMRELLPDALFLMSAPGVPHAFVLGSAHIVAEHTADLFHDYLPHKDLVQPVVVLRGSDSTDKRTNDEHDHDQDQDLLLHDGPSPSTKRRKMTLVPRADRKRRDVDDDDNAQTTDDAGWLLTSSSSSSSSSSKRRRVTNTSSSSSTH